jgi:hypothetical protein
MKQVLFMPKEASLLAAIESDSEFSISQATIWVNMGPAEVRELLEGLAARHLVVRDPASERYSFTKDGLYVKRQLSRGYDKNFWISDEGTHLDSAHVNAALGDAINRLK